jgi:hypothetical protein
MASHALRMRRGLRVRSQKNTGRQITRLVGAEYPDWTVPERYRSATIEMRAGEKRTVVSEWGTPRKIGALSRGLQCEDKRIARVKYGGGHNEGDVSLRALATRTTRAWCARAVGSGSQPPA